MIFLWWFSHFKPRMGVNLGCLKELYYFSSVVFGTGIMNFFNFNIFQILINKFYGSVSLGMFSLAFNIIDLPTQRLAKNVMKVMYPILSKLHQNSHDYEKMFINYMVIIVLIISPFYIFLFQLSKPFILIFYGAQWSGAISLIKILCVVGFLRSLWTGISVVSMSLGRPQFELYLNLLFATLLFPGIFIFHRYGLETVLLLYTSSLLVVFIFGFGKVLNWLKVTLRKTMAVLRLPFVSNLILFISLYFILQYFMSDNNQMNMVKLILISGGTSILYMLILYIIDKKSCQNLVKQIIQ